MGFLVIAVFTTAYYGAYRLADYMEKKAEKEAAEARRQKKFFFW